MMTARLHRHVQGSASGLCAGFPKRHDFGVRPACPLVMATADNLPVSDQDGAHHGIGVCSPPRARRHIQGHVHIGNIVLSPSAHFGHPYEVEPFANPNAPHRQNEQAEVTFT